jgi:hypothetical protein
MKQKTCKNCKQLFTPFLSTAKVCSPDCARALAVSIRGKAEKVAQVREKRETKAKLQAMKTRGQWLAEAKTAIQRFRRLDELSMGSGCMSCGRSQQEVEGTDAWKPGGAWDGGHYMSKGARPELALEPLNIWLQCKSCNAGASKYARKGYTVNASFRVNLIERIGLEQVEWLEGPHEPNDYTIEDLKGIKAKYTALTNELRGNE